MSSKKTSLEKEMITRFTCWG